MKLTELMIAVMLWVVSVLGAFYFGMNYKEAVILSEQAKVNQAIQDTREEAMKGAADAISKITVSNRTIQGKVETVVREVPVYRDCQHSPAVMQDINAVLTGSRPSGDSGVPKTGTTQ